MKKTLLITALLLSGCGTTSAPLTTPAATQTPTAATTVAPTTYTIAQVAEHATGTDCWLALSGKVYNVTNFIAANQHPGGAAILAGCGKDATAMFKNRPDGDDHSPEAYELVKNFYIGDLQ
ncbi:cytochrome b5 domain-containing protein [Candidatus Gracilibacteria bacterium]|nr:cytochrome b5 domain-containing protein [Candidatus Gracilibacteria bacterium]